MNPPNAATLPRTIYVKVSTALLAELSEWSEPVRVKVERDWNDDTFEMVFKREGTDLDA